MTFEELKAIVNNVDVSPKTIVYVRINQNGENNRYDKQVQKVQCFSDAFAFTIDIDFD